MANTTKLQRYLQIIEKVQDRTSFVDLHAHMAAQGFDLSPRTLQRDIEQIRVDLGVEVEYDREANTYQIKSRKKGDMVLGQLMERAQLIRIFQDQASVKDLQGQLELDGRGWLKGLRHITAILQAIRDRKEVKLTCRSSRKGKEKTTAIHPVQVKEFQGRWFILGFNAKEERPVSYSMDAIISLEINATRINAILLEKVRKQFSETIGVEPGSSKCELIKVRFSSNAAHDIAQRSWHVSQKEVKANKKGTTYSWELRPNKDLVQRILSFGHEAQVLSPSSLKKELQDTLKAAHRKYE